MIIGLLGPAGSGKSTVAAYMAKNYGAELYAFADPLKEIVGKAFDLSDKQLYGSQADKETVDPRYNVSPRWLFQRIGTQGIREVFGPDVWANLTLERINKVKPELAVIQDVRFRNEALLTTLHGRVVKLNRRPGASKADSTHASESEMDLCIKDTHYEHEFDNTGTLSDLYKQIDNLMRVYGFTRKLI